MGSGFASGRLKIYPRDQAASIWLIIDKAIALVKTIVRLPAWPTKCTPATLIAPPVAVMSRRDQEMAAIQALPVPLSAKCCPQTQTADIGLASASACSSGFLLIGFEHPLTPSLIQSPASSPIGASTGSPIDTLGLDRPNGRFSPLGCHAEIPRTDELRPTFHLYFVPIDDKVHVLFI